MKKTSFLLLIAGAFIAASIVVPDLYPSNAFAAKMEKIDKSAQPKPVCLAKNRMYGDVKEIDHEKGLVSFTNNAVDLKLHFPPHDIKDLRVGSNITVEMGYYKGVFQE
jgi:hypothetical protein